MLNKTVVDAINDQINNELNSSYLYLAMSAYCDKVQFTGCAHWLRMQSQEEHGHAMRLYDFLVARDGTVTLKAIPAPRAEFESLLEVFELALHQEQETTRQIDTLYELAFHEKAFAALVEVEWFITEQVEEEKTAREIVHKFSLVKDDAPSLLDLDRELAQRSSAAQGEVA